MSVSSVRSIGNQRGSTLLTVLITAAIVVFLGGIIAQQVMEAKRREIYRAQREEMLHLVQALRYQLNDGVLCPQMIGGQTFAPNLVNVDQPLSINTSYNNAPGPITAGWSYTQNYLALNTVSLRILGPAQQYRFGNLVNRQVRMATSPTWPTGWAASIPGSERTLQKYSALVVITPKDPSIFWNTLSNPDTVIPLYVLLNSNNGISQCHGNQSTAETCEAIGGAYDGRFAPPTFRCNPDYYCFKDKQYAAAVPNCSSPYKPEVLSYFGGQYFYFCSWCDP